MELQRNSAATPVTTRHRQQLLRVARLYFESYPQGRVHPYSLGPFTRLNFANVVILYQSKNIQLFLISIFCYYNFCPLSDPVKRHPILDQFSMITRPYPGVNGLKTIPFPAAHNRIASIWEYPPGNLLLNTL